MNKADLTARTSMSKPSAGAAVGAVVSTIADVLASGGTVRTAGFGTLSTRSLLARQGRNPCTGQSTTIAASNTPSFKAGKTPRDTVNSRSSQKRSMLRCTRPLIV